MNCDQMVTAYQWFKPRKKAWMLEQWGKYGPQYVYRCDSCDEEVTPVSWPAYTAIDWTNLGIPIGERAEHGMKPLSPNTISRIKRGLVKFANAPAIAIPFPNSAVRSALIKHAGNTSERPGQTRARKLHDPFGSQTQTAEWAIANMPFLVNLRGTSEYQMDNAATILEELKTISAGGRHNGFVMPISHQGGDRTTHITDVLKTLTTSRELYMAAWAKQNGGPKDTAWHGFEDPFNTFTAKDTTGMIVLPWIEQYRSEPAAITEPLATMTTHASHALANVEPLDISPSEIDIEDVRYRMLDPDYELRRGMGFDPEYKLKGNNTQKTAGLGNAVTPPTANWLIERCVASLDLAA
jgi:DNA (cytosine-5)-methyltransferase 1